jgi:hypothetical protein
MHGNRCRRNQPTVELGPAIVLSRLRSLITSDQLITCSPCSRFCNVKPVKDDPLHIDRLESCRTVSPQLDMKKMVPWLLRLRATTQPQAMGPPAESLPRSISEVEEPVLIVPLMISPVGSLVVVVIVFEDRR